jgi:starch synthase (maltosyl-transferring)
LIGRIPIEDISPVVAFGGEFVPVKAIAHEEITIAATVFREGHDALGVQAVLTDAHGRELQRVRMTEIWLGTDRYEAKLTPPAIGNFTFFIEAFDDKDQR